MAQVIKDDPEWKKRATQFVSKSLDANELLTMLPEVSFNHSLPGKVTYQDSCHLAHGQKVYNQPRELLRRIPNLELIEMQGASNCCGSAGIYNITNYDMSMQILDDKISHVNDTQAHFVVTSNPGCLIQMKHGIRRAGLDNEMQAVHIMELLDKAL